MKIIDNKIEITPEENQAFILQYKKGIIHQLYKENLLTNEQLNQVLKSINK